MNRNAQVMGVLFYDGTCRICNKWALWVDRLFRRRGLVVLPFEDGEDKDEMLLSLKDGREFGGADAAWVLSGRIWWGLPVWLLGWLPGVLPVMRMVYRRIAMSRDCGDGKCEIEYLTSAFSVACRGVSEFTIFSEGKLVWRDSPQLAAGSFQSGTRLHNHVIRKLWSSGTAAFIILGFGWLMGRDLPGWGLMWMMAGSQYLAFKVMALSLVSGGSFWAKVAFVLLWPGMDARAFLSRKGGGATVGWTESMFFVLIGLVLLWGVGDKVMDPVLAGWVGMIGVISLLHFGVFAWVAKFWQRCGYEARPIMEAPWLASSVADFWGRRWNRAFSDVARAMVFRPLSRKWGVTAALIGGFFFSGLAHELVIAVPAGAGYGLPSLYFALQAGGVMIERWIGMKGIVARVWVWIVILGPAYWLFSPVFMERVIVPFLEILNNNYVGLAAP